MNLPEFEKNMNTAHLPEYMKPKRPSSKIENLIKDLKPIIGRPRDFTRHIHVEKDSSGEFGLKGLPTEWEDLLRDAGFTQKDFM